MIYLPGVINSSDISGPIVRLHVNAKLAKKKHKLVKYLLKWLRYHK